MSPRPRPDKQDSSGSGSENSRWSLTGWEANISGTPGSVDSSSRAPETPMLETVDETPTPPVVSDPGLTRPKSQRERVLKAHSLIDKVYDWNNLYKAWRKVRKNKGAHGLDRVTIRMFESDLDKNLQAIQRQLKEKRFVPQPGRKVDIPKGSDPSKTRRLLIPRVTDRVVQQAIYQILNPIFEPEFSDRSYGFRPGRRAHHAIATLMQDKTEGFRHVVDADIKSFFDCIDHQVAMSHIRAKVADGRVLDLIEDFLKVGAITTETSSIPTEGTPQGGVLSPLIANIVLDQLDKKLEQTEWRFVRYADDFVVLTPNREEAEQALKLVQETLQELKLSLSEEKTSITTFREGFDFLGFHPVINSIGVRQKSIERLKDKVRKVTKRNQGRNVKAVLKDLNSVLRGWAGYFGAAKVSKLFREMDRWIRMRIRGFKNKRRNKNDNWRISNRKLRKWGLISLQECRPKERFIGVVFKSGERLVRLPAKGNPRGVAQYVNGVR